MRQLGEHPGAAEARDRQQLVPERVGDGELSQLDGLGDTLRLGHADDRGGDPRVAQRELQGGGGEWDAELGAERLHPAHTFEHLVGFQLTAPDPKSPPELVLMLGARAACQAQYEGMARVVVGEEPDPGPAAARFLAAMDPEILEQAALNRPDLESGPHGLTKAMLRQLTEWASGRP